MPDQEGRDLDARLAALGATMPPGLPGADAARRRGDQRRRHTQFGAAGAGAVVVAGALMAGFALGGGGTDRVSIPDRADQPTATASPSTSTSPSVSASPSTSASPESSVSPLPASSAPSPAAGASTATTPSPVPPTAVAVPVRQLLLTTTDAQRAEAGNWSAEKTPNQLPLLNPCQGGTAYPQDANRTDTADAAVSAKREADGGTTVRQSLARYRDAASAAQATRGYERAVRACPGGNTEQDRRTDSVVSSGTRNGVFTVVVRAAQEPFYAQYFAVQQRGNLVSVLSVAYGSDGDPGVESIQPYLPVVADKLARG